MNDNPSPGGAQTPYERSCRGEITEEEYNWLQGEYYERLESLEEAFERDVVALAKRYRREYEEAHSIFYGDNYFDEGSLASALASVADRTISSADWIGSIAEHAARTKRHANAKPDGFIYVLEAGPYHKIGRTIDLPGRIKTLSIQLPFPVRCIAAFPCQDTLRTERELHERFDKYRANGEWFTIPDREPHMYGLAWLKTIRYASTEHCPYLKEIVTDFPDVMPIAVENETHWQTALAAAFDVVEVSE